MNNSVSNLASQNLVTSSRPRIWQKISLKKVLIVLIVTILLLVMGSFFIAYSFIHRYISIFEASSGTPVTSIYQQLQEGLHSTQFVNSQNFTILLLGTDQLANREGDPVLTDTMMLLNLNLNNGELFALSFPRDLWSEEYKTKINALYQYGFQRYPQSPEQFPKEALEQLSGISIDRTVILRLDQVSELIDIVGGVEINIPESFVDEEFPRSDVDIRTETDPLKLYETVSFQQGVEVMTGERALKYIRSRKSVNLEEGTDDARAKRQQQVISAIMEKMSQPALIRHPEILGQLYYFYDHNFSQQISLVELIEIANRLRTKLEHIQFSPASLSIQDSEQQGVLTHPPTEKYGQWVYEIVDQNYFQTEVQEKLGVTDM